jgi:Fur family ferric uptake transcriptional regulator
MVRRVGTSERDIRAAGLRCTAQRMAVLEALRSRRHHYRVDELTSMVARRLGAVSSQTVYDALGALMGAGLARRIEPAGSAALFEACSGDNHHHLVCRGCGAVADVDCLVGDAPCLEVGEDQGFVIDEAEITFWGYCPDCHASTHVAQGRDRSEREKPRNSEPRLSKE